MGTERFVLKRRIKRCTGDVRKQYLFCGKDIAKRKGKEAAEFRNHEVGFVFRAFNPVNEIRVLENVCMPLGYAGLGKQERRKRAAKSRIQIRDGRIV